MFICRIKIWCAQDQDSHLANGTMPDSRRNENGMLWCYWDLFSVQNEGSIRLTSQNDVNFSMLLVVMLASIGADFSQVYRARKLVSVSKSPPSDATWAGDPRQGRQIDNCWLGWQGRRYRGEMANMVQVCGFVAKVSQPKSTPDFMSAALFLLVLAR